MRQEVAADVSPAQCQPPWSSVERLGKKRHCCSWHQEKERASNTFLPRNWKLWLATGRRFLSYLTGSIQVFWGFGFGFVCFVFTSLFQTFTPLLSFRFPFLFQTPACQFWHWSSPYWLFLTYATGYLLPDAYPGLRYVPGPTMHH